MNNKYKKWMKCILLPHIITVIFLGPTIIIFGQEDLLVSTPL